VLPLKPLEDPPLADAPLSGFRLLVVEDDADTQEALRSVFERDRIRLDDTGGIEPFAQRDCRDEYYQAGENERFTAHLLPTEFYQRARFEAIHGREVSMSRDAIMERYSWEVASRRFEELLGS